MATGHHRPSEPWRRRAEILLASLVLLAAGGKIGSARADEKFDCSPKPYVRVKIASVVFSIPKDARVAFETKSGKIVRLNPRPRKKCTDQEKRENTKVYSSGFLKISRLAKKHMTKFGLRKFHDFSIELRRTKPSSFSDEIEIRDFLNRVEESGRNLGNLPKIQNILAFGTKRGSPWYLGPFMSTAEGVTSPSGQPVVVKCSEAVNAAGKFYDVSAHCDVRYRWAKGLDLQYRFYGSRTNFFDWPQIDEEIRQLLNRMATSK